MPRRFQEDARTQSLGESNWKKRWVVRMPMNKWNGSLSKTMADADSLLHVITKCGCWFATSTDTGDPMSDLKKLMEASDKINKLAKYAIESGRVSVAKAAEVMGADPQDISIVERT